ncbi:MAG: pyruvate/2-oxoglutarate/acetoin dehydrogenase E1 component [Gammaproteobacteria bacterium]|jgi:pyruvate/2-oxoglutarate/acetoin dehydrogenase E1 component
MSITTSMTFSEAIRVALTDAMHEDDHVILMGEDIGAAGGPFGVTSGLLALFGDKRVLDFPVSEAAMVGSAYGAALCGYKPVVEIMFMDFATLAMDAIVNQAAKAHFMFGGQYKVPMVIRMAHGGDIHLGAQHSQCLEAWFAHIPGLIVVCPSDAVDAYNLLRASIGNPNPVIFIENKTLYNLTSAPRISEDEAQLGRGRIVREGSDITVVTYGAGVQWAKDSAADLAADGVDIEIIDLRTIQPWDEALVIESLKKTHRLVICHEAVTGFGVGAEVAACMAEISFADLRAPIRRLGAAYMPVPYAPELESHTRPDSEKLSRVIKELMTYA